MPGVIHPLFVHIHIALLLMGFISMYYWLFKGLATSVFENRIYTFARFNTLWGLVFVVLSMVAGVRDAMGGYITSFSSPLGRWLYVKVALGMFMVIVYGLFLFQSGKKKQYLQDDPRLLLWCLATQLIGFVLTVAASTIGTMVVYYPHLLKK